MDAKSIRFDLPDGCSVSSVKIKETTGRDEALAGAQAKARGGFYIDELTRLAIIEVDGLAVKQPFLGYDDWTTRTRALVTAAFNSINNVEAEEVTLFLKAATAASGSTDGATVVNT
jgi:hypothetical protein